MIGPMLRILIISLVLLAGATVWVSSLRQNLPAPVVATFLPEPLALPAVRLTDEHGGEFSTDDLAGDFTFVFFGFTNCPDICPITLQTLANVNVELSTRNLARPRVLFVSVDPERDTPTQIERYLGNFSADFKGVTGNPQALEPLTAALGVFVERHQHAGTEAYSVTHNSTVYLIGPEAELIAVFGSPHDASVIASDFVLVRQLYMTQRMDASASS